MNRLLERLNPIPRFDAWQYGRLANGVPRREWNAEELVGAGYASQCGQDRWIVEECFPGLRGGTFVDVGAHDGVSFSNTLFLERNMGWGGIAVEPMPEIFERLERNRNCIKVRGCIAAKGGESRFRRISGYSEMLSGLVENYDARHLERIRRELESRGGSYEEFLVPCYRLNDVAEKHGIHRVDYLNIDVEGAELGILRSIDFSALDIRLVGVENNYRDPRFPRFMKSRGFRLVAIIGDEFYERKAG